MRIIALDTESTGISAIRDRIVEIGMVEIIDGEKTGKIFHAYINPKMPVGFGARRVHGLSNDFLKRFQGFREQSSEILSFIQGSPCIAQNGRFDRDMLLHDFQKSGLTIPKITFFDSIPYIRTAVSLPKYNLDAVSRHFGLIKQNRGRHGALTDAYLLADILLRCNPSRLEAWMTPQNALGAMPDSLRDSRPVSPIQGTSATRAAPEPAEQAAVNRIRDVAEEAIDTSAGIEEFFERLSAAGLLIRPVINKAGELHGLRLSTPEASCTGGDLGLSGMELHGRGIVYREAEHGALVRDLVRQHDHAMGSIMAVKARFSAVPAKRQEADDPSPCP